MAVSDGASARMILWLNRFPSGMSPPDRARSNSASVSDAHDATPLARPGVGLVDRSERSKTTSAHVPPMRSEVVSRPDRTETGPGLAPGAFRVAERVWLRGVDLCRPARPSPRSAGSCAVLAPPARVSRPEPRPPRARAPVPAPPPSARPQPCAGRSCTAASGACTSVRGHPFGWAGRGSRRHRRRRPRCRSGKSRCSGGLGWSPWSWLRSPSVAHALGACPGGRDVPRRPSDLEAIAAALR